MFQENIAWQFCHRMVILGVLMMLNIFWLMSLQQKTAKLPIKDLLEDELLLTLPLSPKHQDCDMPVQMLNEEKI